jgi:hypothetical protein
MENWRQFNEHGLRITTDSLLPQFSSVTLTSVRVAEKKQSVTDIYVSLQWSTAASFAPTDMQRIISRCVHKSTQGTVSITLIPLWPKLKCLDKFQYNLPPYHVSWDLGSITVMLLHEDRRTNRLAGMAQLTGTIMLLLTVNVLKFYEQTNVIIKGAHFIKRFSFTESRV